MANMHSLSSGSVYIKKKRITVNRAVFNWRLTKALPCPWVETALKPIRLQDSLPCPLRKIRGIILFSC